MILHTSQRYLCYAARPLLIGGRMLNPADPNNCEFTTDYGTARDLVRSGRAIPGDDLLDIIGGRIQVHDDDGFENARWIPDDPDDDSRPRLGPLAWTPAPAP